MLSKMNSSCCGCHSLMKHLTHRFYILTGYSDKADSGNNKCDFYH